jgi:hypothetical protein
MSRPRFVTTLITAANAPVPQTADPWPANDLDVVDQVDVDRKSGLDIRSIEYVVTRAVAIDEKQNGCVIRRRTTRMVCST